MVVTITFGAGQPTTTLPVRAIDVDPVTRGPCPKRAHASTTPCEAPRSFPPPFYDAVSSRRRIGATRSGCRAFTVS